MDNSILKMAGISKDKSPMFKDNSGRILANDALMYIASGHGYFEDANTPKTEIGPGCIFYLRKGLWHNFDPNAGTIWTECWALFDAEKAQRIFGQIIPKEPVHRIGISPAIEQDYETLRGIWHRKTRFSAEHALFLLHSILMRCFLETQRAASHKMDSVAKVQQALRQAAETRKPFDLQDFARQEGIGYEKLRKDFAKETGLSPMNYLMDARMAKAMEMLIQPQISVKEVAERLGFDDPYYFSRLFKRRKGVSPKAYRKSLMGRR